MGLVAQNQSFGHRNNFCHSSNFCTLISVLQTSEFSMFSAMPTHKGKPDSDRSIKLRSYTKLQIESPFACTSSSNSNRSIKLRLYTKHWKLLIHIVFGPKPTHRGICVILPTLSNTSRATYSDSTYPWSATKTAWAVLETLCVSAPEWLISLNSPSINTRTHHKIGVCNNTTSKLMCTTTPSIIAQNAYTTSRASSGNHQNYL